MKRLSKSSSSERRFWSKIAILDNGCWQWTGSTKGKAYGSFDGMTPARWCYLRYIGPLPAGFEPDHLCRNKPCVNPLHLEGVTHKENTRRSDSVMGINSRKTHCLNGHPLSGDNLMTRPGKGWRNCRTCHLERMAARYRLNRARILASMAERNRKLSNRS